MKKILILLISLLLVGCTHTTYVAQNGTRVSHTTFMANEKIDDLYFVKDANSIHFQMGSRELSPAEIALQAFQMGFKVGASRVDRVP